MYAGSVPGPKRACAWERRGSERRIKYIRLAPRGGVPTRARDARRVTYCGMSTRTGRSPSVPASPMSGKGLPPGRSNVARTLIKSFNGP